jgi:type I restriction enzyme S subunit
MSEIKDIPKHWQLKQLGKVCDKISLNGIKIKQKEYLQEGKFPVVDQGQELIGGYFDDEKLIVPNKPPYIIFGDHTKVKKYINFKFITGADGVKVLKPHSIYNPKFFFYLIHTVKIPDKGYARHFQFLEKEQIPVPPLPEQQAIVSKIEELFSDLENGKQQLQTAQQQLKVYRQSLLKWAFEGKLTNKNVKAGELPKGWKQVQIKEVADTFGGYAFKSGEFLTQGKYQVLRMGNVRHGIIRYGESPVYVNDVDGSVLNRALLQLNDVIITQTGTRKKRDYGFTVLIKKTNLLLNQRIAAIRFKENYLPKFFLYFSWTDIFKDQFFANETGNVGQGNVGMKAVTETLIPCCSLKEQQLIVDELESKLTICDKIEETISQSLQQAETLRQSILKKAFEGKLVQTDVLPSRKRELA